jgi:hypothetical protein
VPEIDAVFEEPARNFYDNVASDAERRRIDAIVVRLCSNPSIDDVAIFAFGVGIPDLDGRLYLDGEFRIAFRLANEWTMSILNMGFDGVPPESIRTR